MSFRPLESEPEAAAVNAEAERTNAPIERSELRLSAPACQHDQYERIIEDERFARAQCLRCPHSWVEVDISVRRGVSGTVDPVRRYPKLIPRRFDEDGLDPLPNFRDLP